MESEGKLIEISKLRDHRLCYAPNSKNNMEDHHGECFLNVSFEEKRSKL